MSESNTTGPSKRSGLDSFLDVEADTGAAPDVADAVAEGDAPAAKAAEPQPAAVKDDPARKVEAAEEDDAAIPEDVDGTRRALIRERARRNDYKSEAARVTGERDELRRQLDEAKRAPVAAPVPPPAPVARQPAPSPLEDPEGYEQYQERRRIDDRFAASAYHLRKRIGDEAVARMEADFRMLHGRTPGLDIPANHPDPYEWAHEVVTRAKALEEIGPDPVSYKEKLKAQYRAEWEAEQAELSGRPSGNGRQPAAPNIPRSLNGARNSGGPPTGNEWTGPTDLDDILAPVRNRNRGQG